MKWTRRLEGFLDTCESLIWIGSFVWAFVAVYLWAEVGFLAFLICAVLIVAGVVFGLLALSLAGTVVEISENTYNTYTRMVIGKTTASTESQQETENCAVSNSNADLLGGEKDIPVSYVCDKCGAHYVKGSYFCEKCGNKL